MFTNNGGYKCLHIYFLNTDYRICFKMCPNRGKSVVCFICDIEFPNKLLMLKHVSDMHKISDGVGNEVDAIGNKKQNDSSFIGDISVNNITLVVSNHENNLDDQHLMIPELSSSQCGKDLESDKNMSTNLKLHHREVYSESKIINCVLCDVSCRTKQIMVRHYENDHDIKIVTEVIRFDNIGQYLKWKKEMERKTVTKFVKYRNKYFKSSTKNFYRCHRDGTFKTSGRNIRQLKSNGSNKINGHCPAKLEVCKFKGKEEILVKFTKTHVGHKMEIQKINLDKEERRFIASKLANKVPNKKILDEIRNSNIGKLERLKYVTMKDLHNIKKSISDNEMPKETNHKILHWIKEIQDNGNSSYIKFFKPFGTIIKEFPSLKSEDLLLIVVTDRQLIKLREFGTDIVCIDIHHDDDHTFDVAVLSVIDEKRQSFPSAFLFCNILTKYISELFFEVIKSCLGFPLKSRTVMTDNEDFFHSWCSVMLFSPTHLYPSWLLKNRWQKNAESKIHSLLKQQLICDKLEVLIEEKSREEFEKMLSGIYHVMQQDFELESFGHYFEYFKNNKQSWAQCYRDVAEINYSILFERLNRSVDFIYNQEQRIEHIDTVVDLLIDFMENKFLEIGESSQEIMKRHELCLNSMNCLSIIEDSENAWIVSCLNENVGYKIEKGNLSCLCKNRCDNCDYCIHAYVCSCDDSYLKMNMCIHIHLVCQFIQQLESRRELIPVSLDNNLIFSCPTLSREECSSVSNEETLRIEYLKNQRARLMEQFSQILELDLTSDEFKFLENELSTMHSKLKESKKRKFISKLKE